MSATTVRMDPTTMRTFLWSGPVVVASVLIGMVPLMGFIPPPSPALSAGQIAQIYAANETPIRIACLLLMICWTLWATWGAVLATFIRRMESGYPVLTYTAVALVGGGLVFFLLIPMTWAVAAFRPGTISADVTQTLNDWAWFSFLYTWPPFGLFCLIIAIAILKDHNIPTLYPRWVGYLNIWIVLLFWPAGLIAFFKVGPFAIDGIFAFWVPVSLFFAWMVVMTVLTARVISNEQKKAYRGSATQTDNSQIPRASLAEKTT